jgi:uncharacterized protein (DUF885 family)
MGDSRFDGELTDPSPAARRAWVEARRGFLDRAQALRGVRPALSPDETVTLELLIEELATSLDREVCRFEVWAISPRFNAFVDASDLAVDLRPDTPARAAALRSRLKQVPATVRAQILDLRTGLREGLVTNAASAQKVLDQVNEELKKEVTSWAIWQAAGDEGADPAHRAAVQQILEQEWVPAFTEYRDFLEGELLPAARPAGREGLAALSLGPACYQTLVREFTTLPAATAEDRHAAGLRALEGIHAEFRDLGERTFGTRDLGAIFTRLREDPALRFTTEDEVQAKAEQALARARETMPRAFGILPQQDCVVVRIPAHEAPYTTIAYYRQPTPEEPGRYYVNTWQPTTRPRHEAEVLAYHESIPGHHLQIAIAQERKELPAFRRHLGATVFVEGWALYIERLADEMGLYSGDLDRLGMLSFDAWRASRLVVDTGVHHYGWSRERAESFLRENTPLALNNVENEVDRYVTWPGQALAYKTGQIEIWRIRREAEAELGTRFDLRGFHDVVLAGGAVTLPVLEARVLAWVRDQKAKN